MARDDVTKEQAGWFFRDNATKSSDKWQKYLAVYSDLFRAHAGLKRSVLEIGVQNGGFTEVLAATFADADQIVGVDIDENCANLEFDDPRISVVIGDASNRGTVTKIREKSEVFSLILDDGSHKSSDIVAAFCHYFPMLEDGGIFIAEDLHCSYWLEFEGGLFHDASAMQFFKLLADILNFEHWGIQTDRLSLIRPILEAYELDIAEDQLACIDSVSFTNSVCIVGKKPAAEVVLGKRFVTDNAAIVADNRPYDQSDGFHQDQSGNPYASFEMQVARAVPPTLARMALQHNELSQTLIGLLERTDVNDARVVELMRRTDVVIAELGDLALIRESQAEAERARKEDAERALADARRTDERMSILLQRSAELEQKLDLLSEKFSAEADWSIRSVYLRFARRIGLRARDSDPKPPVDRERS